MGKVECDQRPMNSGASDGPISSTRKESTVMNTTSLTSPAGRAAKPRGFVHPVVRPLPPRDTAGASGEAW
jgi:hypothetical protein